MCVCVSSYRICSSTPAPPSSPVPLVTVTSALGGEGVRLSPRHRSACVATSSPTTAVSRSPTLSPVREIEIASCLRGTRARRPPSLFGKSAMSHRSSPYDTRPRSRHAQSRTQKRGRRSRLRGVVADDTPLPSSMSVSALESMQVDVTQKLSELRTSETTPTSNHSPSLDSVFGRDDVFSPATTPVAGHNQDVPLVFGRDRLSTSDGSSSFSRAITRAASISPRSTSCRCGTPSTCRQCTTTARQRRISSSTCECVCRHASSARPHDDTTPDELASYLHYSLHIPKEMCEQARMMYA